jgi:hypothetical protein
MKLNKRISISNYGGYQMTKRGICALCRDEGVELSEHHATNKNTNIILICGRCHKLINEGEE